MPDPANPPGGTGGPARRQPPRLGPATPDRTATPPAPAHRPREGRVLLAAPRGFCAGVVRAVDTVEEALALYGPPVYVRNEIVHNQRVVADLRAKGAVFVAETDQVPEGATVILSAHGVAPTVRTRAAERHLNVIDATCPLVSKVHREAVRYAAQGYTILLIGHAGHEEVIGTLGHAPDQIRLVDGPEQAARIEVPDASRTVWLSQTTLSVDETTRTVEVLKSRFPQLLSPPSDDICYATQNRQAAVKLLVAGGAQVVIVLGSANSSNSRRLVDVADDAGARAAHLVDHARDIAPAWLRGVHTVGVTSGASAPETLVTETLTHLADRGYTDVHTLSAAQETTTFALPHTLHRPGPDQPPPMRTGDQALGD
ncbi:4-hydroxy-3-methylbut-2-enyl diphosphate reductase [Streptomyces bauhiniae]